MTVIARSEDEIVAEVMDAMPQMKGWREAGIGWRVWTQDAIRRALALTADQGAVEALESLRAAWNAHMKTCTTAPSFDEIAAWMSAPSNTASAEIKEPPNG